jgi:D-sedoheptulose 7-phosphate isomerase
MVTISLSSCHQGRLKLMKNSILSSVKDSLLAIEKLIEPHSINFIEEASLMIAKCYKEGGKIIIAGNGGSLCDAMHFAEELTGQFRKKRRALPAIALADSSHITCCGNDFGFDEIFSRGVEAFGKPCDIFVGLSTSGNSANIIKAFEKASELNLKTIAFLGKSGGVLKGFADLELVINGFQNSDRIQEAHMTAIHIIIEIVEKHLFYTSSEEQKALDESPAICC